MTIRVGPFAYADPEDDPGVATSDWSRMARNFGGVDINSGVVGHAGGTVAKVYADGAARVVKVMPGYIQLRGHYWYSDATQTVTIAANTSGSARLDLIVCRLDPDERTITLEVVQGTPGASPVEPAETVTDIGIYEVPLAVVRVENGTAVITADKVYERRLFRPHMILTGATLWWPGLQARIPAGFLYLSNTPVSRDIYYRLFKEIGTLWGSGDGSTTFNVPPPGHVPVSRDPLTPQFVAVGNKVGEVNHQLTVGEMPTHDHEQRVTANRGYGTAQRRDFYDDLGGYGIYGQGVQTGPAGGSQPHNNLQPTMVGHWLIKT